MPGIHGQPGVGVVQAVRGAFKEDIDFSILHNMEVAHVWGIQQNLKIVTQTGASI